MLVLGSRSFSPQGEPGGGCLGGVPPVRPRPPATGARGHKGSRRANRSPRSGASDLRARPGAHPAERHRLGAHGEEMLLAPHPYRGIGELFRSHVQVPQARSHSPAVWGRGRVDGDVRAEAAAAQRGGAGERAQLCGARPVKARAHGGTRGELDRSHAASTSPEGTPARESRRRVLASNPPCRHGTPPGVPRIPLAAFRGVTSGTSC